MDCLRTDEGMKQNKLKFKLDRSLRGRPHKLKANNRCGGRNLESKFHKEIKTNQGLKSIMMMIDSEEKTN